MKKVLFGASALLAASAFASSANAAEPLKLQLGGYMDWYVAAVDQDDSLLKQEGSEVNTFDVIGDGEVHFLGETVLDNGVKVGVQIEMEAGNRSSAGAKEDVIDESFVTVDTSYGRVMIGATDNVGVLMHASAPDVGRIDMEESNLHELFVIPTAAPVSYLNSTWINTDGDANKLSYITPTMYGTTFGVSYIPGGNTNGDDAGATLVQKPGAPQTFNWEEGYVGSAMYSGEFSGVGVTVTGAYATFNVGSAANDQGNRTEWSTGTNLTMGGFTFGGGFRHVDAPAGTDAGPIGVANDGYAWNAGVSYEAGPYGVSVAYMKSEVEGANGGGLAAAPESNQDSMEMYMLSGKYNLGAGVDTFASLAYAEYEDEAASSVDVGGWALMTGIALAF